MPLGEELSLTQEEEKQLMGDVPEEELPKEEPADEPTEEPKEKPAEEPKEAPKEEPKETPKEPVVPREHYEKIQEALRQERASARQLRQQLGVVDELKQQILSMRESLTPKPTPAPDFREDPLGFTAHKLEQIEAQNQNLLKQQQATAEVSTRQAQQQQFVNTVVQMETNFRETTPDYDKAFQYMRDLRKAELEDFGVTDPDVLERELNATAFNVSLSALRGGRNPAEVIYRSAVRYGYKPDQAKEQPKEVPKPDTKLANHLEDVKKGQELASKSLSKGGGEERTADVNSLLEAEGKDFDELWAKVFGK